MRKALIAVIAAAVLFAVGAFAASLAVDSENVASGEAPVGSCATEADVNDWQIGTIEGTNEDADWSTTAATVELTEAAADACADAEVTLAVYSEGDPGGWDEYTCDAEGESTTTYSCVFGEGELAVRPIIQVAVLVNGDTFDAPRPSA